MTVDLFLPEIPSSEKLKLTVYCHGFKGFKDWGFVPHVHDFFVTEDHAFLTFNHSHNGVKSRDFDDLDSFSVNSVSQELRDMESIAFWLVNEGCELYSIHPEKISWLGHSRGGANVLLFASKFPEYVDKVVTWAAVSNYQHLFRSLDIEKWKNDKIAYINNLRTQQQMPLDYSIYQDLLDHKSEYDVLSAIQKVNKPVLLIHGKLDDVVPFQQAEELFKACSHSVLIPVEDSGHTFGCAHPMKDLSEAPTYFWTVLDNTLEFISEDIEL